MGADCEAAAFGRGEGRGREDCPCDVGWVEVCCLRPFMAAWARLSGGVRPEKTCTLLKCSGRKIVCAKVGAELFPLPLFFLMLRAEAFEESDATSSGIAVVAPGGLPQLIPSLSSRAYERFRLHVTKLGMTVLGSGLLSHNTLLISVSVPTASLDPRCKGMAMSERDVTTHRVSSVFTRSWHRTMVEPTRSICIETR